MDLHKLLPIAINAAEKACSAILDVYNSDNFHTEQKGDSSPLTLADKHAHAVIVRTLQPISLPILSEEGKEISYEERRNWEYFWMVDPLDGTKEFIKRNGEFTVNIALIHGNKPVLGVVAVPVMGELYHAVYGEGAYLKKSGQSVKLPLRTPIDLKQAGLKVVASRSHMDEGTEAFINNLKDPALVSAGSSLKFMLLATGKADVYPRYAPTMEWDTAAAQIIVEEVGLRVVESNSHIHLRYNKPELLNPFFLCR